MSNFFPLLFVGGGGGTDLISHTSLLPSSLRVAFVANSVSFPLFFRAQSSHLTPHTFLQPTFATVNPFPFPVPLPFPFAIRRIVSHVRLRTHRREYQRGGGRDQERGPGILPHPLRGHAREVRRLRDVLQDERRRCDFVTACSAI